MYLCMTRGMSLNRPRKKIFVLSIKHKKILKGEKEREREADLNYWTFITVE